MTVFEKLPPEPPRQSTAIALGMFDGLHRGHWAVLTAMVKKSAEQKLLPCVFTFSTESAMPAAKTNGHLLSRPMRDKLLHSLGIACVYQPEFLGFRDMTPEGFVRDTLAKRLNAKLVACGDDFRFGKNAAASAEDLKSLFAPCGETSIVSEVIGRGGAISTTRIRKLVQAGDIPAANDLLGRAFAIDFPVEHGRQLGRTLNWPTINQAFPADFVVPKLGVYATITAVGGSRKPSVTNVGNKPTVGSDHILAETYIQGFSGDLYGQSIPVEFVKFLRDETKFDSLDALRRQIEQDNDEAAAITKSLI